MPRRSELTITHNGVLEWRQYGRFHREDGPALIRQNGTKIWVYLGKIHREDGPAVIYPNGTVEWWEHGTMKTIQFSDGYRLTNDQFNAPTTEKDKQLAKNHKTYRAHDELNSILR